MVGAGENTVRGKARQSGRMYAKQEAGASGGMHTLRMHPACCTPLPTPRPSPQAPTLVVAAGDVCLDVLVPRQARQLGAGEQLHCRGVHAGGAACRHHAGVVKNAAEGDALYSKAKKRVEGHYMGRSSRGMRQPACPAVGVQLPLQHPTPNCAPTGSRPPHAPT